MSNKMGYEQQRLRKDYGTKPFRAMIAGVIYSFDSEGEYYVALWLEWRMQKGQIKIWQREGALYNFLGYDSGPDKYVPDFHLVEPDGKIVVVEYKTPATLDQQAIIKLKRMQIHYPDIAIILIMDRVTEGVAVNKRASASKYIRGHKILDFSGIIKETRDEICSEAYQYPN